LTTSERSILSEFRVVQDRELLYRERLLLHRERTPFAEVDLVFESSDRRTVTMMEVKTWSGFKWAQRPVSHAQERRLSRARAYLEARVAKPVRLQLALVKWVGVESEVAYLDFPLEG
jgi:Holliday junction resolvase-like predicted endonuclease